MDFELKQKYSQKDIYKLELKYFFVHLFSTTSRNYIMNLIKYKEFTAAKYVSKEDLVASASRLKAMIEVGKAKQR
jgi:hypothetical protein